MVFESYSSQQFTNPEWAAAFYEAAVHQKQSGTQVIIHGIAQHPEIQTKLLDPTQPARILLVGPDQGHTELPVVSRIIGTRNEGHTVVDAVDPNPTVGDSLKHSLLVLDDESKVNFRFFDQPVEEFVDGDLEPYDLVIAAHSLQYVAFEEESSVARLQKLTDVLNRLETNSSLMAIIAQANDRGETIFEFRRDCWDIIRNWDGVLNIGQPELADRHFEITSDVIIDALYRLGAGKKLHDHVSYLGYSWFMDMSAFPEHTEKVDPEISKKARSILSFLIRKEFDKLPKIEQVEILACLERTISCGMNHGTSLYFDDESMRPAKHLRGIDYAIFTSDTPSPIKRQNALAATMIEAQYGNLFH
ncbi:MAG: hypothetical protein V4702_01875 [Patescibacteria group bacterium]